MNARVSILTIVLVAGCGVSAQRTLGEQCELNSDCNAPLVCGIGRCHEACATNRDCPFGTGCALTNERLGVCLLPDERTCVLDSDCTQPLVCRNERCVNVCEESRDCPAGSTCLADEGGRSCEPVETESCTRNSDCAAPLVCGLDATCRPMCREDRDCASSEACVEGTCMLTLPGLDAGLPDASVGDGGPIDAALDGGEADAGGGDAGPPPVFECSVPADCVGAMTTFDCRGGRCVVTGCAAGVGDCDLDPTNGCEATLDTIINCGGCARACVGPGSACAAGGCNRIAQLVSSATHTCYRWDGGEVFCFGANRSGELGDGTTMTSSGPVQAMGVDAIDVSVGNEHTCALLRDASVACWGDNGDGQIGDGTQMQRLTPTAVVGLPGPAVDVSAGDGYSCAVLMSGAMYCWGTADEGVLGDGTTADVPRLSPTLVLGGHSWTGVAAGGDATCGVRADGRAMCFGDSGQGQLGNAGTGSGGTPIEVASLTNVERIQRGKRAISARHACASTTARELYCWGSGTQVGYGGVLSRDVPTAPAMPTPIDDFAVGDRVVCATRFGELWCWGETTGAPPVNTGRTGVRLVSVSGNAVCTVGADERLRCGGMSSTPAVISGF